MARKKEKLHSKARIASRSAAAKKAWETRRKKYGKSGIGKTRKPRAKKKPLKDYTKKEMAKVLRNMRRQSSKGRGPRTKSRGRMRIYTEGGGHVTVPR